MDRIAHMVGEKVGQAVEGAVKQVLGVKDSDKKKGGGGGLSLFGGNKKTTDEGKGGFLSNLMSRGDDSRGGEKASGFRGLFSEQEAAAGDGGVCEYTPAEGAGAGGGADLYDDLLDVAEEMSAAQ